MKRTSVLLTVLTAVALFSSSCGTSDYVQSVTLSSKGSTAASFVNLPGVDGTIQFSVTANYHGGKTVDVTNSVTWNVAPVGCAYSVAQGANQAQLCPNGVLDPYGPNTVPISKTGLMTAISQVCTWVDAIDATTNKPANPAAWLYTGYYQVTATYKNWTSQPIGVGVGVTTSNIAGCGPA